MTHFPFLNFIGHKDFATFGTLFVSLFGLVVTWTIFRANKKHNTRLKLYEPRKRIYEVCRDSIEITVESFLNPTHAPIDLIGKNKSILSMLHAVQLESFLLLPDMHKDIKILINRIDQINQLQHLLQEGRFGSVFEKDGSMRRRAFADNEIAFFKLENSFRADYKNNGKFMIKFYEAMRIMG